MTDVPKLALPRVQENKQSEARHDYDQHIPTGESQHAYINDTKCERWKECFGDFFASITKLVMAITRCFYSVIIKTGLYLFNNYFISTKIRR